MDLRPVDDAGQIDLSVRGHLREGAEDRPGADDRGSDADPARGCADSLRDPMGELVAAAWAKPGPDGRSVHEQGRGVHFPASLDVSTCPELLEVLEVASREIARVDREDQVLLPRPGVGRPVRRARPKRFAVSDHVFVVHQVGDARNRGGGEGEPFDELRVGLRRHRHRRVVGMVEVVGEPDVDAPCGGGRQRTADDRRERVRQPDVVDRDLERALRGGDEVGECVRGLFRGLAAVGESPDLYRAAFARCSAL